jgi:hypothetical protein
MRARSRLARLQQATALGLAVLAVAFASWRWSASPAGAIAGGLAIFFSYSFFLAAECVILKFVQRTDPVPQPAWPELARAWWAETWIALVVFFWRQPFRWRAEPDCLDAATRGKRGVVFVHGFVCNRGLWTPWLRRVRESGHAFVAVNLEPVFGSIDDYVPAIDDAVRRVSDTTGLPPLIVGHSMGGLAIRAWLRAGANAARVHRVVTIGTPHRGTWLGRFSHTANGRQMRHGGDWVARLAEGADEVPFTCWYSNCDHIVFPASTATLPHADNRFVRGVAHVELAFQAQVVEHTLAALRG